MKHFFNFLFGFMFSMILQKSGVPATTWNYWVLFGLFLGSIVIQYIDR